MKLMSGKRIGQSGYELVLAVFLSFFLHAGIVVTALILYSLVTPRISIPPAYQVRLVGHPATMAADRTKAGAPAAQHAGKRKHEKRIERERIARSGKHRAKKTEHGKRHAAAMPEAKAKARSTPEKTTREAATGAAASGAGKKQEGVPSDVAVSPSPKENFPFPPYLAIVRDKIERIWHPPTGVRGVMAKVLFRVHRSGRVVDVTLAQSSGNFYFDQAAVRVILASSPFPPMPDEFFRDSAVFSVDLKEKE